jgi:hypothetical protein
MAILLIAIFMAIGCRDEDVQIAPPAGNPGKGEQDATRRSS